MTDFITSETQKIRRERIATAALSAMLQSPSLDHFDGMDDEKRLTVWSVRYADALIAELDKVQP